MKLKKFASLFVNESLEATRSEGREGNGEKGLKVAISVVRVP